jgi:sulfur-carrier protein
VRNVRAIIAILDQEYSGSGFSLCYETGEVRPYVNKDVDRANSRYLQGLDTPVRDGATIHVLQSVAGG